uniref:Uncharacterized protein n=1 Tax=Tanacetum cinerariifolium TaxID=118510 RepID=A0A6L2JZL7_TANCI|nr:hypothetical protein [Tanacetum cinerariifolium]
MTLKDFLYFPRNRSASFFARPANVPMSVGIPVGSAANVPDEELEMVVAASVANNAVGTEVVPPSVGQHWWGVVARSNRKHVVLDEGPSSPKFVPDIAPSNEACKTLFGSLASMEDPGDSDPFLPGIEESFSSHDALCHLSYPDVQRHLNGLTLIELTNFHDVVAVRDFFPHAVERLLSSDHLSSVLAGLQEKAMLVGRSQALREVASSGIGVELVDMKDLIPVRNKIMIELSNPSSRNASAVGPSASPFL